MSLPPAVRDALAAATGAEVVRVAVAAGGDVNRAARVALSDGRDVFVKHSPAAPPGGFLDEADGLRWLAEAGAMRIPEVVAAGDDPGSRFLALEWVEGLRPLGGASPARAERFGRALAALHGSGAPAFGLDRDTHIAGLPLPNSPCDTWGEFYLRRRLEPLARRAVDEGRLPLAFLDDLDRLAARIGDLAGPPEPAARLHGDLWSGNAGLDAAGAPVVLDPAAHGGHREIDLAMMRLFGGFPERAHAAYAEALPLADGHGERVALWQLHPLLVHVCLFGGGYAGRAQAALSRYVERA